MSNAIVSVEIREDQRMAIAGEVILYHVPAEEYKDYILKGFVPIVPESARIRLPEDSKKLTDITDSKGNKLFEKEH